MTIDYLKKILTSRVYDVANETPLELAPDLSRRFDNRIYFKREDMQSVFSFKLRGAYNKMANLSPAQLKRGVICASAGNHAQGVALAAQLLGIRSTVFMPEGAPIPKEKATRAYGADVVFHGRYLEDALIAARAFAEETGAVLIHPFDHVDIVTGQGTCGLEILDQCPDVKTIVVSTGVTVTVAVPLIVPLVAVIVLAKVPGVLPAVKRPAALIVPPPLATFFASSGTRARSKVWCDR